MPGWDGRGGKRQRNPGIVPSLLSASAAALLLVIQRSVVVVAALGCVRARHFDAVF
jgi:hypothetical protein